MRQLKPIFSSLLAVGLLIVSVQSATAQNGASASTNSSANASANAGSTNARADAQVKAEAAKQAAAKTSADAQAKAEAQAKADVQTDVKLNKPSWPVVLDRLFGTPDNGLLDGKKAFQFRAEDVRLSAAQSSAFFSSSSVSSANLSSMIKAAEALQGNVRIDGTIEGKPFELKLAGRELKVEGITLTAAQRESLVTDLRGISGLHETKIEALVDGRANLIQIAGGRERIELLGRNRDDSGRSEGKKVEIGSRADVNGKVEIDRPAKLETHERVETSGRVGGTIEKPELPRIGK